MRSFLLMSSVQYEVSRYHWQQPEKIWQEIWVNIGSSNGMCRQTLVIGKDMWRSSKGIIIRSKDINRYNKIDKCISKITSRCPKGQWVNALWPSDPIWRQGSRSTLVQVMVCCLTAPSHYLNQCWLIITKAQWCSSEGNFAWDITVISH